MADRLRYAFRMRLKPGAGDEYRRLHEAVDPTVLHEIRAAGIHNYSIFIDGTDLFCYLEIDDLEPFAEVMRRTDGSRVWAQAVTRLFAQKDVDPATGMPPRMPEVFRFDE